MNKTQLIFGWIQVNQIEQAWLNDRNIRHKVMKLAYHCYSINPVMQGISREEKLKYKLLSVQQDYILFGMDGMDDIQEGVIEGM